MAVAGRSPAPARAGERDHEYTGRHASPRRKTARKRVGKAVPAAAAAATLAAGAAAYTLAGGGQPQASQLNAAAIQPGAASALGRGQRARGRVRDDQRRHSRPGRRSGTPPRTAARATPAATTPPSASKSPAAHAHGRDRRRTRRPRRQPRPRSTLSCNLNYSMLPQNVTAIVSFLLAHGYSHNAAAGIAGNIYQESKGDPEAVGMGGGGLIGWTPLRSGFVTGNPAADLQTQLAAMLDYNQGWSSYLPALNAAASPASAAYIYVTDFERAGIPAACDP